MVNECDDVLVSKICRFADTMYRTPSVETGCFPYFLTNDCINCSAISIVLFRLGYVFQGLSYLLFNYNPHNQTNSSPTLIRVSSSTTNS